MKKNEKTKLNRRIISIGKSNTTHTTPRVITPNPAAITNASLADTGISSGMITPQMLATSTIPKIAAPRKYELDDFETPSAN